MASHQRAVAAAAAGHTAAEVVPLPLPAAGTSSPSAARRASPPLPGQQQQQQQQQGGGAASTSTSTSSGSTGPGAATLGVQAGAHGLPPRQGSGLGGGGVWIREDESLSKMDPSKLAGLRPYFKRDASGTVTAGNASPMTDGAAALVVASYETVQVRVRGWSEHGEGEARRPAHVVSRGWGGAGGPSASRAA